MKIRFLIFAILFSFFVYVPCYAEHDPSLDDLSVSGTWLDDSEIDNHFYMRIAGGIGESNYGVNEVDGFVIPDEESRVAFILIDSETELKRKLIICSFSDVVDYIPTFNDIEGFPNGSMSVEYTRNGKEISENCSLFSFYRIMDGYQGFQERKTNIPIFNTSSKTFIEDLNNFILNGDYSGALNSEELDSMIRNPSESVEMPQNFKCTSGMATGISPAYGIEKDFSCTWNQTVDTSYYKYEYCVNITLEATKTTGKLNYNGRQYSSGWVRLGEVSYKSAKSINLTIPSATMDDFVTQIILDSQNTDYPINFKQYTVSKIQFRVRNFDISTDDNYCSDWVVFTATLGGSSVTEDTKKNEVRTEDFEGNDTTLDVDNPYGEDYDPLDNDNISNVDSAEMSVAYFLDLIRSGFGFSGEHGLLKLFSSWFSWLPSPFMSIVMVGFGLIVFVSVVRVIIDILT